MFLCPGGQHIHNGYDTSRNMTVQFLLILFGLALLYFGAQWFVCAASSLALGVGVTPLLVGLTVVAYGTSVPELAVSSVAALQGKGDIVLGNVLGANTFNLALILGVAALCRPLRVKRQLVRFDAPLMIVFSVLCLFFLFSGHLTRLEGLGLLAVLAVYTFLVIHQARRGDAGASEAQFDAGLPRGLRSPAAAVAVLVASFGLLLWGADLMVDAGVVLARRWGVSEAVIGLTIISMGTSLPEFAVTVTAGIRGEADIAIGNIIGSVIFRILGVLGLASVLSPIVISGIGPVDFYAMIGSSILATAFLIHRLTLLRWEGAILVAAYLAYLYHLLLNA